MRNRACFFSIAYVYLRLRGKPSHELNRLLFYWLSLPKVALHLHTFEGLWTLSRRWTHPIQSPTVAIARVAVNRQLSIEINGIASLRVACSVNGAADNIIGSFLLRNTLDTTAIKDFFCQDFISLSTWVSIYRSIFWNIFWITASCDKSLMLRKHSYSFSNVFEKISDFLVTL